MSEIEKYIAPDELSEAVRAMAQGGVTVLAGGTDLTPQIDSGKRAYQKTLMNIRHIDELSLISLKNDVLKIGALVTVSEIRGNELLHDLTPILGQAADHFASDQIRNAATLGGNICNASPAGDMINPLLVLGAEVELASWKEGRMELRSEPLETFFTGPGQTKINENELLTAVIFDKPSDNFVSGFRKSGPRPALEISTVSVGLGGDLVNGIFSNVRLALGAVAATPIRARATEQVLEGQELSDQVIALAVEAVQEDARPIDDIRATKWYRNHLVQVFTEELLDHVRQK